jgi:hypothetical protein
VKQCIVKGRMDVAGSARNHRGQIHRGEVQAVTFVPPEGLKVQPVGPQAESYQDNQEEERSSGCWRPIQVSYQALLSRIRNKKAQNYTLRPTATITI